MEDSIRPEVSIVCKLCVGVAVQRDLSLQGLLILGKERDILDDTLHLAG